MKGVPKRIVITAKDIAIIEGCSERKGRDVIDEIRVFFKKEKHHRITFTDYARFANVSVEELEDFRS